MFERTLLLAGAALALATPALAGGFSPTVVPAAPTAPVVVPATPVAPSGDWTGFYLGGQAATATLDYSQDTGDDTFEEEFDGTFYGIHAGYMRDFGRFVLGGELAYDMGGIDFESEELGLDADDGFALDSMLRAGVRLGYDAGRVLPYVTAGYARANLSDEFDDLAISTTQDGHYFGAGVEYAVSERFSVGAEVLRHSFDIETTESVAELDATADVTTFGIRASFRF